MSAAEFVSNEVLYARRPTACWAHDVLKCCLRRQLTLIWNRASVCRCHRSSIHTIRLDSSTFPTHTRSLSTAVFNTPVSSTLPHRLNAAFLSVEHENSWFRTAFPVWGIQGLYFSMLCFSEHWKSMWQHSREHRRMEALCFAVRPAGSDRKPLWMQQKGICSKLISLVYG